MSQRGNEGKRIWRERSGGLAERIADQVTAEATTQMRTWARRGRVPFWLALKTRLQGQRIGRRPGRRTR